MRRMVYRFGPSLAALLLYAFCLLLWRENHTAYETLLRWYDFMTNAVPYSDLGAILQAGACWRQGVDVYQPSACMHGGVYNYAPLLLRAAWLGLGPADRAMGGLMIGGVFLAGCTLLPPPRTWGQTLLRGLALCSGVVMYALESANFDVLMFLLCLAGVRLLLLTPWRLGLLGYALFALGGALKFYPAVLLALALRESRKQFATIAGLVALAGGLYLWRYGQGTLTALAMLPEGLPFRGVFGAVNLPFGLALLRFLPVLTLEPDVPQFFAAMQQPYAAAYIIIAARLLTVAALYSAAAMVPRFDAARRALPAPERLFLAAGAGLLAFCFFVAQNLDYRAIYLLFTLPGLALMARLPEAPRRAILLLTAAEIVLLWEAFFRHAAATGLVGGQIAVWLLRECLWWFVVVRLTAIAFGELRDAGQALAAPANGRTGPGA